MILKVYGQGYIIDFTLDKCLNAHFYCSVDIHILCGWHQNEIALKEDLYSVYVTGYWKTDHNVTLGLLYFIAPANSHTHTLPVHCYIKRISLLVCFSRAGFANHVRT